MNNRILQVSTSNKNKQQFNLEAKKKSFVCCWSSLGFPILFFEPGLPIVSFQFEEW